MLGKMKASKHLSKLTWSNTIVSQFDLTISQSSVLNQDEIEAMRRITQQDLANEYQAYLDESQSDFEHFQTGMTEIKKQETQVNEIYQRCLAIVEKKISVLQSEEEQRSTTNLKLVDDCYKRAQEEIRELLRIESELTHIFEKVSKGLGGNNTDELFAKLSENYAQIEKNSKVNNCEIDLFDLVRDTADIENEIANLVEIPKTAEATEITYKF